MRYEMNRGFKSLLSKLVEFLKKSNEFKEKTAKLCNFKDIVITHTRGLSTGYASHCGIVIGF